MELIDRYVNEIGRRLPRAQRADVRAELRSSLYDALEARGGGEPSEEDIARLLKEFGRPEEVAASYRPSNRYLIGPELYPIFKLVLGVVLLVLAGALVLAFGVGILTDPGEVTGLGDKLLGLVGGFVRAALNAAGVIVLIFVILQRLEVRPDEQPEDWNPRDLPEVAHDSDLIGRGEAVAEIVFPAIFLAMLYLFRDRIGVIIVSPGFQPLLNDVLKENLPWMSAALLLGMALHTLLLWQGHWRWYTRVANTLIDLFGVWVLYQIGLDVAAEKAAMIAGGLPPTLVGIIVQIAWIAPLVAGALVVAESMKILYRTFRRPAEEPAPLGGGKG